jgi:hypothetical protein
MASRLTNRSLSSVWMCAARPRRLSMTFLCGGNCTSCRVRLVGFFSFHPITGDRAPAPQMPPSAQNMSRLDALRHARRTTSQNLPGVWNNPVTPHQRPLSGAKHTMRTRRSHFHMERACADRAGRAPLGPSISSGFLSLSPPAGPARVCATKRPLSLY